MKQIDKRACSRHIDPKHRFNLNDGILHVPEITYVLKTSVRNIGGRRMLVLYLYSVKEIIQGKIQPSFVVFQASDSFITFDHRPEAKTKWRESELLRMPECRKNLLAFHTYADEKRVLDFCKVSAEKRSEYTGISALSRRQSEIKQRHALKASLAREKRIAANMRRVKPAGKRFQSWAEDQALPKYIIYDYRKGAASMTGRCTACGETVTIAGARHNRLCICPNCKRRVTLKSQNRSKRIWDRVTVAKIDRLAPNEMVIRIFKLQQVLENGQTQQWCYESARTFVTWDENAACSVKRYWNSCDQNAEMPWRIGTRPKFSCFQKSYAADKDSYLYTEKLSTVLHDTPWQYSEIGAFFQNIGLQLDVETYLSQYLRYPCIEYLVKLRLFRLAEHVVYYHDHGWQDPKKEPPINLSGRSFSGILGLGREDLPLMQEIDVTYEQLTLLQYLRQVNITPDKGFLQWCQQYNITQGGLITVPLRHMTQHKLSRYITEQYEPNKLKPGAFYQGFGYYNARDVLSDYRDYLLICEGLSYDLSNSFILFPKDLKQAHNQAAKLSTEQKTKLYDYHIARKYETLSSQYSFRKSGMMIVAPKTAQEIVKEGQSLHHCVGTYVERMVKDECQILFLRKEEAPDKSFFTIELRDGQIQQVRGSYNVSPPPQVEKFLKLWQKAVLDHPTPRMGFVLPQAA